MRAICATFRAEKPGSIVNCCEVVAAGGLRVSDCATTTVALSSLELRITGPSQAAVGSNVRFEIAVTNRTAVPVTGLLITDHLDPGLENPAVNQRNAIERALKDLAPGATQLVNVTVGVTRPGRLCHTIEVTGKDVAPARQQACLMGVAAAAAPGPGTPAVPSGPSGPSMGPPAGAAEPSKPQPNPIRPSFAVKKTGPKRHVVDEMADFSIELANTGSLALRNIKVFDRYDAALLPKLATDGYRVEDGGLSWTVDELAAGQSTELRVQCLCKTAAAKTCNRVKATTPDGTSVESEACLEIAAGDTLPSIPPPSPARKPTTTANPAPAPATGEGLNLAVVGLTNPVTAGKELTYKITVTNTSSSTYRELGITALVPEGVVFSSLGTGPVKFTVEGRTVRFEKMPELRPGASLDYRVHAKATQHGRWKLHVELTTAMLAKPLVQEASTEVN